MPLAAIVVLGGVLVGCASSGSQRSGSTVPQRQPASSGSSSPPSSGSTANPLSLVQVQLRKVASVSFPTALAPRPGTDEVWITERRGTVRRATEGADGSLRVAPKPVLAFTDQVGTAGEEGLLSLAFSRDGNTLYLSYDQPDGDSRVVSYRLDGDRVDTTSRTLLLAVNQPPYPNHKGGELRLGPDGKLWFGLGDGGSEGDPDNRGQDPHTLLAKILRLDPAHPGAKPEIVATGLRNPWRFSFDSANDDLWIGDVGQNKVEEVDLLPASQWKRGVVPNYGWSGLEGREVFKRDQVPRHPVPPLLQTLHSDGWCALIGGWVYRGHDIPALQGAYVFGDLCRDRIRAVRQRSGKVVDQADLAPTVEGVVAIEADAHGELYVLTQTGPIYRLAPG